MIKKDQKSKQEINTEIDLKKRRMKKREFGRNRYHNMSEEKKQRITVRLKKSQSNNYYILWI